MTNLRRLILGATAVGCLFGITWLRTGHNLPGTAAQASQAPEVLKLVWSKPERNLRAAAISPDGAYVALAGNADNIFLWQRNGTRIWKHTTPNISHIAVSSGGTVIGYTKQDPTNRTLTLLRGDSTDDVQVTQRQLDGTIWDVKTSADGRYVGIVTGNRSLYLYTISGRPRYHRWQLDGIGNSVAMTGNNSYLTTGTWDQSGVSCYSFKGDVLWQYPSDSDKQKEDSEKQAILNRLFETQVSNNGQYVLGMSYSNIRRGNATLYFWRNQNPSKAAWTIPFDSNVFYPAAEMTPDGQYIAVTYKRLIEHGDQSILEQRISVYDHYGNQKIDKGGLLYPANLVSMAADGHRVTVSDGQRNLYNLDLDGHITPLLTLDSPIKQTYVSKDGRFLLIYTGSNLNLYKFQQG